MRQRSKVCEAWWAKAARLVDIHPQRRRFAVRAEAAWHTVSGLAEAEPLAGVQQVTGHQVDGPAAHLGKQAQLLPLADFESAQTSRPHP